MTSAETFYKQYSGMFSIVGIHTEDIIHMSQWDYDRLAVDEMQDQIFLVQDMVVLKKKVRVDIEMSPGQVKLCRRDYEDLELPPTVKLLRLHPLILEAVLFNDEKDALEHKLLLISILIHMDGSQVMHDELLDTFNADARAYDIEQIRENELRNLVKKLIDDKLVTFKTESQPPVLYPVVKLDNKQYLAEAIGIELEGLNSELRGFVLASEYRLLKSKYHLLLRKTMLFTIFIERHLRKLSTDMGSCINVMHTQIKNREDKKHRLLPFTGLDSKLWRQIRPLREEFINELNKQEQISVSTQFSLQLWEVRL